MSSTIGNTIKRILYAVMSLIFIVNFCLSLEVNAYAATVKAKSARQSSYTGTGAVCYTITTGNKADKLTITQTKAKVSYKEKKFFNPEYKNRTSYVDYKIIFTEEKGGTKEVFMLGKTKTFKLKANTTYTVEIQYLTNSLTPAGYVWSFTTYEFKKLPSLTIKVGKKTSSISCLSYN